MSVKLKISLSVSIFFLSLFLIGQNLEKPFWGEHDVRVIVDQDRRKFEIMTKE